MMTSLLFHKSAALETTTKSLSTSNLAYARYMSGTTVKPKGVLEVGHFGVLRMLEHVRLSFVKR